MTMVPAVAPGGTPSAVRGSVDTRGMKPHVWQTLAQENPIQRVGAGRPGEMLGPAARRTHCGPCCVVAAPDDGDAHTRPIMRPCSKQSKKVAGILFVLKPAKIMFKPYRAFL